MVGKLLGLLEQAVSKLIEVASGEKDTSNSIKVLTAEITTRPTPSDPQEDYLSSIDFNASTNFSARPADYQLELIVLHHTGSLNIDSTISWFKNPKSKVSAHYVVGRDGTIVQMVKLEHKAWHAGDSTWSDKPNVNVYSVGVEIVGDGKAEFTDEQYEAVAKLCKRLITKYDTIKDIVGHKDIALPKGRKTDPAPWDADKFKKLLYKQ